MNLTQDFWEQVPLGKSSVHLIISCLSRLSALMRLVCQLWHPPCTAVSSERISQHLPGNVAALGGSSPLRRSLEPLQVYQRSWETDSLSRLSGCVEASAKCVSMGSAHCRKMLQNPVSFSSASIQRGCSHPDGPRAGSGHRTRSKHSLEKGCHRGGPSSWQRVWDLQPVLHRWQEGFGAAFYSRSASAEPPFLVVSLWKDTTSYTFPPWCAEASSMLSCPFVLALDT